MPLNPVAVLTGVGVGVALADALADGVAFALAVADALGFAVAVEFFVGVGVGVEVGVEVGFAVAVELLVGVAAGVDVPPPRAIPPPVPTVPTELLSAGGVIERTAPKPVTVPTAIKIAFFIPVLSLFYLRGF